jgi:hypothetical protein
MVEIKKFGRIVMVGGVLGGLAACDDLLDVEDPSRFTDEDLDKSLEAVANGVEGDLHANVDGLVIAASLLGDEWQHTGTWTGYGDTDNGRVIYDNDGTSDGGAGLLRARFAAQDASERFDRLELEGETVSVVLRAQVEVNEGWADLLLAQHICEAPWGQDTEAVSDMEMYARARDKLAANTAPANWVKLALYQQSFSENSIVNLNTIGYNNAAGMREKWWSLVDDAVRMMNDPLSNSLLSLAEPDPRVPIRHDAGVLGVDGETPYYSQWKYQVPGADIPITHLDEMRLIQAEVAWAGGQYATARGILNGLRTTAGLSPIPDAMADDQTEVFTLLLNERFAELFMEGQRTNDLHRFGLVPDMMAAGDFIDTEPQRPTKFPISGAEGLNNPNIENDAAARCLPLVSSS